MEKKYKVTEKGTDFLGRKTYNVREVSNNSTSSLELILIGIGLLIVLIIFTLPSGLIAAPLYFIGNFLNSQANHRYLKRDSKYQVRKAIALRVSIFSILLVLITLVYTQNNSTEYTRSVFEGDAVYNLAGFGILGYLAILFHFLAARPAS